MVRLRPIAISATLLAAAIALGGPAQAADKVRFVTASGVAWTFTLVNVGITEGIFAKYGVDAETSAAGGDAKVQQALAAKSAEFGLGSGPSMAFTVKGAPQIAVAAFANEPRNICIMVGTDSPIKSVKDLKGKKVAVTTAGSLTEWLTKQASIQEGLGPDGITPVALGTFESSAAALRVHEVDGVIAAVEAGYAMEEKGAGHILQGMEKYAPNFITHVVYARKDLIASNPDLVRRTLQGVFATIHFMKTNKAETVEIGQKALGMSAAVLNKTYDYEISMFNDDGTFNQKAIDVIDQSYIDLGTLPSKPPNDKLFDAQFVPVKF